MDQQLLLGILLVVVGIAIGMVAVAVILNRRTEAESPEEGMNDPPPGTESAEAEMEGLEHRAENIEAELDSSESGSNSDEAEPDDSASAPEQGEAKGGGSEAATTSAAAEPGEDEPEPEPQAPLTVLPAASADPPGESLLAELHRDPMTGALFVRSASGEFRSAADISDRTQHERLASAAADLAGWFQQSSKPTVPRPRLAASDMVQAIDAILQRSLETSGASARGVKLIQDASGGVKVLIGVKSYEVDQVPDDDIRRLIKQAVAEWEAHQ